MNIISDKVYRNTYVYYIKRVVIRSIPVYIIREVIHLITAVMLLLKNSRVNMKIIRKIWVNR